MKLNEKLFAKKNTEMITPDGIKIKITVDDSQVKETRLYLKPDENKNLRQTKKPRRY
jgi:hypothetical protein